MINIDEPMVRMVLKSYVDDCIKEALRTELPDMKSAIHEQVKKIIKLEQICGMTQK